MLSEPRAPVDAAPARIRESRFSIRQAEADVNFWQLLRNVYFLAPNAFGIIFRILGPKSDSGAQNALFAHNRFLRPKGINFHQYPIGFISIRGMGTEKYTSAHAIHFGS